MKHRLLIIALSMISLLSSCNNNVVAPIEYEEFTGKVTVYGYYKEHTFAPESPELVVYQVFENFLELSREYTFLKSTYHIGTSYEVTIRYPKAVYMEYQASHLLTNSKLIKYEYIKDIKLLNEPEIETYTQESFMYEDGILCGVNNTKFSTYIDNSEQNKYTRATSIKRISIDYARWYIKPLSQFEGDTLYGFNLGLGKIFYCFTEYPNFSRFIYSSAPLYNPEYEGPFSIGFPA